MVAMKGIKTGENHFRQCSQTVLSDSALRQCSQTVLSDSALRPALGSSLRLNAI